MVVDPRKLFQRGNFDGLVRLKQDDMYFDANDSGVLLGSVIPAQNVNSTNK